MASFWGLDLEALWKGGNFGAFTGNCVPKAVHSAYTAQAFPL